MQEPQSLKDTNSALAMLLIVWTSGAFADFIPPLYLSVRVRARSCQSQIF